MEFWKLIVSYYSDLNFYNLQFDPMALLFFVGAIGAAGVASVVAAYVSKKRTGRIIDPLLERHATSAESAISAKEGGFSAPKTLMLLKKGSMLRKTVSVTEAEAEPEEAETAKKGTAPTKSDVLSALMKMRFYVPEEKRDTAQRRYSGKKAKATSVIVSVLLMLALTVTVYFFLPVILRMVDNFITMTGGTR